jgi:SseB protein N-terminal domain
VITLDGGQARFRGDDGSADEAVAAALRALGAAEGTEHAALTALASSRLLVPVVATASEAGPHSEMSVPTLIGRDGRPAILAFTCLDALARWRPDARPVPGEAARVWRAAAAGSAAVVIDIAGPVPLAVDGARLAALAAGQPVPLPHQDPDVLAAVRAAAGGQPAIAGLDTAAGQDGTDLAVRVTLAAGCSRVAGEEAIRLLGAALMAELGARLRRGISIAAAPGAGDHGAGNHGARNHGG